MADNTNINWQGDSVSIQHPLPGQIVTPGPVSAPEPVAVAIPVISSPTNVTPATEQSVQMDEGGSYAVTHGDTLASIATQHNLSADQLKALNPNLSGQSEVHAGQLLTVNADNAPTAIGPPTATVGPQQSSYTMANTKELEAAVHKELAGWTGQTNAIDPARNAIQAVEKPGQDTNPLKIDNK